MSFRVSIAFTPFRLPDGRTALLLMKMLPQISRQIAYSEHQKNKSADKQKNQYRT
jgi:hypothetical protein